MKTITIKKVSKIDIGHVSLPSPEPSAPFASASPEPSVASPDPPSAAASASPVFYLVKLFGIKY